MNLNEMAEEVYQWSDPLWWTDINTGEKLKRNKGELIALQHSELSEALEGERKGLMDDKLPHYPMAVVEQIDELIRKLDYLSHFYPDINLDKVFKEKMDYNRAREDHKHEARKLSNGKKF